MRLANAWAMHLSGVTRDSAEVDGGEVLRDVADNPIGVFREAACSLIRQAYDRSKRGRSAEQTRDARLQAIQLATEECLANGV